MDPKITVLIPTFNRARYLAECLDSLFGQTLPACQIIVVNDGSADHTLKVLEPYRGRVDYLETAQLGKPCAINRGLEIVRGDYLWIFDDDDAALPEALHRLVEPLEQEPRFGFSYSNYFFTSTDPTNGRIGRVLSEYLMPDFEKTSLLIPLLWSNVLGGASLFARMSCYREVGLFDPALYRSQDYDMAIRIVRRYSGIRVPGGPTFHYRQHLGLRGNSRDQFTSRLTRAKWLEYDQIIFRRLYRELALSEYLPPQSTLECHKRQALLQRFAVMTRKFLLEEALADLSELAQLPDHGPLNQAELTIVRRLIEPPYYGTGNFIDRREIRNRLRKLAASSAVASSLKRAIFQARVQRCVKEPSLRRILGLLWRLFY